LDDLSPLLPLDPKTVEEQFGKPALSDVIALAEKTDASMVAEVKKKWTRDYSVLTTHGCLNKSRKKLNML